MASRRAFLGAAAAAVILPATTSIAGAKVGQADFLFVQTARGLRFDKAGDSIILEGISPITVFFSDRPERIAGNMKTTAFVPFWSTGKDSFLSDPPNADISLVNGHAVQQIVAVLQNPVLQGENLAYKVKVLDGEMPAHAKDVSVFIDVIGMPLTPVSYAGVARRGAA